MAAVVQQRVTAQADGEFVVFLIGMRINRWWKIHKWLPIVLAMPRMLGELYKQEDLGLISHEQWFGRTTMMVQYWRSFEHLEAFASSAAASHLPAWMTYNQSIGSRGDVGIWHETYRSGPGQYECVYNNMPPFGLARAMTLVEATGPLQSAGSRMQREDH